ncbi:MAG: adenylate/guanylate cyclase domain-containing protein [Candidatus Electryonea clarkiae]|nr:adenylate/guanylate cyclase domain-containing protein [Candidatus Electryonea clarkiae]MDP8288410.1 adenylate/guanylate cyclase domain-containing protein [Candidatus Electryonea clarkiae]
MSKQSKNIVRTLVFAGIGLVIGLLLWFLVMHSPFGKVITTFEDKTYDLRAYLTTEDVVEKIEEVVIIDIDGRSIYKLGRFSQWSRELYGQLLKVMDKGGAAMVAFDILFDPDDDYHADSSFASAIQEYGRVCLALDFSMADSNSFLYAMDKPPEGFINEGRTIKSKNPIKHAWKRERMEFGVNDFYNKAALTGFVNNVQDDDGVIRRTPLVVDFRGEYYPSFSLIISSALMGWDLSTIAISDDEFSVTDYEGEITKLPLDGQGKLLLHYRGPFQTFRYVSFYEAVTERIPPSFFQDKIVLVGTSFTGLADLKPTPIHPAFPGVEIHATALHNLVVGDPMKHAPVLISFLVVIFMTLFASMSVGVLRVKWAIVSILLLGIVHFFVSIYLYDVYRIANQMVLPGIATILTAVAAMSYKYLAEEKEKTMIRGMFSQYVPQSVVNEIVNNPHMLKLGGERRRMTALFTDVAGFTTVSEKLTPDELVGLLNVYLSEMSKIILDHDGIIDKYEGDLIMAEWGAPVFFEDHAYKACCAALKMQNRLAELREKWKETGEPILYSRVGINTGEMIVGNMGCLEVFDYTVMGDAVNLASRLEGANKSYESTIMIGMDTYEDVKDKFVTRMLDDIQVKGKNEPVRVYELVAEKVEELTPEKLEVLKIYDEGLEFYRNMNFAEGHKTFEKALEIDPDDGPSKTYLDRCANFILKPPRDDWDRVYVLTEK